MRRSPIMLAPLLTLLAAASPTTAAAQAETLPWDRIAQVARTVNAGDDRIQAAELADALIKGIDTIDLIDLRLPEVYQSGHIADARNIPLVELLQAKAIAELSGYRKLVLYSDDGTAAAQAVALLRLAGHNAHVLVGGYQAWQAMTASAPPEATPTDRAKQQAVACYFEGDYLVGAGLVPKPTDTPPAPAAPGYSPAITPIASKPAQGSDPLGLGLGLGLGDDLGIPAKKPAAGLIIGEGC